MVLAPLAGLVAGALSMAAGEYVSVSSQILPPFRTGFSAENSTLVLVNGFKASVRQKETLVLCFIRELLEYMSSNVMEKEETLRLIYYSPTGTTKKIVKEIGKGLNIHQIKEYNLTTAPPSFDGDGLTIIGLPTYSGRLPANAVKSMQKLKVNHAPVVIVVVYGNRDFDDALLELKDLVENIGFTVIAAAVFVGEHSYSTPEKPVAQGRPDASDINRCHEFSQKIATRITAINKMEELSPLPVPGHFPYKAPSKPPLLLSPETNMDLCDMCGICADVCPTRAISLKNKPITDKALCTWCCACVKYCPHGARMFNNPTIDAIQKRLFANCSERKEPEFFV